MRVVGVAEGDVCQLRSQGGGEASLIGQHVQQTAANDNGLPHRERLEQGGEQHAAFGLYPQVTAGNEVVDHDVQNLVDTARRRQEAGLLEALQDIGLCLALQERRLSSGVDSATVPRSLTSLSVWSEPQN